jgi:hypothetical protein
MKNVLSVKVLLAEFTEVIFLMVRYDTVIITSGSLYLSILLMCYSGIGSQI